MAERCCPATHDRRSHADEEEKKHVVDNGELFLANLSRLGSHHVHRMFLGFAELDMKPLERLVEDAAWPAASAPRTTAAAHQPSVPHAIGQRDSTDEHYRENSAPVVDKLCRGGAAMREGLSIVSSVDKLCGSVELMKAHTPEELAGATPSLVDRWFRQLAEEPEFAREFSPPELPKTNGWRMAVRLCCINTSRALPARLKKGLSVELTKALLGPSLCPPDSTLLKSPAGGFWVVAVALSLRLKRIISPQRAFHVFARQDNQRYGLTPYGVSLLSRGSVSWPPRPEFADSFHDESSPPAASPAPPSPASPPSSSSVEQESLDAVGASPFSTDVMMIATEEEAVQAAAAARPSDHQHIPETNDAPIATSRDLSYISLHLRVFSSSGSIEWPLACSAGGTTALRGATPSVQAAGPAGALLVPKLYVEDAVAGPNDLSSAGFKAWANLQQL